MNKTIRDILVIIGSFIFSAGINAFVISGIWVRWCHWYSHRIILCFSYFTGITIFVLNAILIIVGYKYLSKRSTYLTIFATVLISIFLV